jgi:hypothetical protein
MAPGSGAIVEHPISRRRCALATPGPGPRAAKLAAAREQAFGIDQVPKRRPREDVADRQLPFVGLRPMPDARFSLARAILFDAARRIEDEADCRSMTCIDVLFDRGRSSTVAVSDPDIRGTAADSDLALAVKIRSRVDPPKVESGRSQAGWTSAGARDETLDEPAKQHVARRQRDHHRFARTGARDRNRYGSTTSEHGRHGQIAVRVHRGNS